MKSSAYPNNLWSGDIYIVSAQTYDSHPRPVQTDPLTTSKVALYRFDGIAGGHSLQSLRGTSLAHSLAVTLQLCQYSLTPISHPIKTIIELFHQELQANSGKATPPQNIGGFEDVIMALSPEALCQRGDTLALSTETLLRQSGDRYEQTLYTTIYQLLKSYDSWGEADMDTRIHPEIDPTRSTLCVVPQNIRQEAPELWPALWVHYQRLYELSQGHTTMHVDPDVMFPTPPRHWPVSTLPIHQPNAQAS